MNLNDIIALAKQGYKPADIKELLALADVTEPEATNPEIKDGVQEPKADEPIKEPETTKPDASESAIDYKKLYEDEKAKVEKIQKDNLTKNIKPETPSLDDQLADIVRGFM